MGVVVRLASLDSISQMSTDDIVASLKPGAEEPLRVKADGTIMDGNTRVAVLQSRGVDTNALPRTPYQTYVPPDWVD